MDPELDSDYDTDVFKDLEKERIRKENERKYQADVREKFNQLYTPVPKASEHDIFRELSLQIEIAKNQVKASERLSASYKRELDSIAGHVEQHNQSLSNKSEHDKIQELSLHLEIVKDRAEASEKLAATYKRQLDLIAGHVEEHNQSLSNKDGKKEGEKKLDGGNADGKKEGEKKLDGGNVEEQDEKKGGEKEMDDENAMIYEIMKEDSKIQEEEDLMFQKVLAKVPPIELYIHLIKLLKMSHVFRADNMSFADFETQMPRFYYIFIGGSRCKDVAMDMGEWLYMAGAIARPETTLVRLFRSTQLSHKNMNTEIKSAQGGLMVVECCQNGGWGSDLGAYAVPKIMSFLDGFEKCRFLFIMDTQERAKWFISHGPQHFEEAVIIFNIKA